MRVRCPRCGMEAEQLDQRWFGDVAVVICVCVGASGWAVGTFERDDRPAGEEAGGGED